MRRFLTFVAISSIVLIVLGRLSPSVSAHAALVRSDPPAGAQLDVPPAEIRMWFAEPLEEAFSGADLLDATGTPVAGASAAIAPHDNQELILTLPSGLSDGPYTVAWHTLSAADGHNMESYFGFRIGAGTSNGFVPTAAESGNETARALTRGLALLGLAAILAIAPVTLFLFDPLARAIPALSAPFSRALRAYALGAAVLAFVTTIAALIAQTLAVSPGEGLVMALGQTLTQTRYGQLWNLRILLIVLEIALVLSACWSSSARRRFLLPVAAAIGLVLPLPFSLLSHAAATPAGAATAITADVLHLLAAAVWGGGLLLLAVVLVPTLRQLPSDGRNAAVRFALPRFSIIGVTTWIILAVTGLYAAWLQVGTLRALLETPYGQTLMLKGALLVAILALAAFHFMLGWRDVRADDALRVGRTIVTEALLVVAVFLVIGRLIGLEPARAVLASQQPTQLVTPLSFETQEGVRQGQLEISPGATGVNTFVLDVVGAPLPEGSEGVLRFALPAQGIGAQELRLPESGPNQFKTEGPELALAGEWQIEALVRKIGDFSWKTQTTLNLNDVPPASPQPNPAPLFGAGGMAGMMALAVGLAGLAAAIPARHVARGRRLSVAAASAALLCGGVVLLGASRLPGVEPATALVSIDGASHATPAAASPAAMQHDHVMSETGPATHAALSGVGTPVTQDDLVVMASLESVHSGQNDVLIAVDHEGGVPLDGAHVVIFPEMVGMSKAGTSVTADQVAPGRYVARDVPLTMSGDWHLLVRVSPQKEATHTISVALTVP